MFQKKTYFFLMIFFAFFQANAQVLKIPFSKKENKTVEAILLQNKDFGTDTISLKKYLNPLLKDNQFLVVYEAVLANGISVAFDQINHKSNHHYLQSIGWAKRDKKPALEIWTQLNYISYLYNYRDYVKLTPLLLEVINKTQVIAPDEMIFPGESFKKIAWILQSFGDYKTAMYYLELAEAYTAKNSSEYASVLNSIGTHYFKNNDSKKALYYYYKTAKLSQQIRDTLNYAKSLGYIAEVRQKEGDLTKAISLLKEDIRLSESCGNDKNTMHAAISLSELYVATNDLKRAEEFLDKAIFIARSKSYFNISEHKIIKLQLTVLQKQNNAEDELILRRRLSTLDDSLKTKDGEIAIGNASWIFNKTKFEKKLNTTKLQYQQESFFKIMYAIIAFFAILIALLIYFNFKKRLKKRQLDYTQKVTSLENDKVEMEKRLSEAHEDLSTQIEYLKNKNVQIKKLKSEIITVKESSSHYLEEKRGKLNALLESHLMTESNWHIFKREFEKEHPDFYQMLLFEYKEITDSNMRILLLQKLNFSNTEIAELLGVTTEAIKKSKQRLRKKLGEKYEKLEHYLSLNA